MATETLEKYNRLVEEARRQGNPFVGDLEFQEEVKRAVRSQGDRITNYSKEPFLLFPPNESIIEELGHAIKNQERQI